MKLYRIKKSKIDNKGRGLYATRDIKAGTKIINYIGKIITNKEVETSDKFDNKKPIYLFTLNKRFTLDGITVLLLTVGPIMAISLAVGLTVALFQALTQIQEMTLTFVPKIIATFVGLIILLPFMIRQLTSLMDRLSQIIITGS